MHPVPGTITDPAVTRALDSGSGSFLATGAQLLELARALATVVHAGQSRKGEGEPYIQHVERVAGRVTGWRAKTVAFLHDVIEDTAVTPYMLETLGFPREIVRDVLALSRREGETYADFIGRTIRDGSDDALAVKAADLTDNLTDPWAAKTDLAQRYLPAAARIRQELERRTKA